MLIEIEYNESNEAILKTYLAAFPDTDHQARHLEDEGAGALPEGETGDPFSIQVEPIEPKGWFAWLRQFFVKTRHVMSYSLSYFSSNLQTLMNDRRQQWQRYSKDGLFDRIFERCQRYQRAIFNRYPFPKKKFSYSGHLLMTLIIRATEKLKQLNSIEKQIDILKRLKTWINQLLRLDHFKNDPTLLNYLCDLEQYFTSELKKQEQIVEEQLFKEAIARLTLLEHTDLLEETLLAILFDFTVPNHFIADLVSFEASEPLALMSYTRFCALYRAGYFDRSDSITCLYTKGETFFHYVQNLFLKPRLIEPALREIFRGSDDDPFLKSSLSLGMVKRLLHQGDFGIAQTGWVHYPQVNESLDRQIQGILGSILTVRNRLYALDYFHSLALTLARQGGELSKLLAHRELENWCQCSQIAIQALRSKLLVLNQCMNQKRGALFDQKTKVWLCNMTKNQSNFNVLIESLQSTSTELLMIERSLCRASLQETANQYQSRLKDLKVGLSVLFTKTPAKSESSVTQLKPRATFSFFDNPVVRSIDPPTSQIPFETVLDRLRNRIQGKQVTLLQAGVDLARQTDPKAAPPPISDASFEAILPYWDLAIQAIDGLHTYQSAYQNQYDNLEFFSWLFGGHGRDGITRSIKFCEGWQAFASRTLLPRLIQALCSAESSELPSIYQGFLVALEASFRCHYQTLEGGNRHARSFRSYVLAYFQEIQHAQFNPHYLFGDFNFYSGENDLSQGHLSVSRLPDNERYRLLHSLAEKIDLQSDDCPCEGEIEDLCWQPEGLGC